MKAQHRLRAIHRSMLLRSAECFNAASHGQVSSRIGFEATATTVGKKRSKSSSSTAAPIPAPSSQPTIPSSSSTSPSSASGSRTMNPLSMVEKAVKERVKTHFLQEAAREDSRLWQNNDNVQPQKLPQVVNGESKAALSKVNGAVSPQSQKQQQQQQQQHSAILQLQHHHHQDDENENHVTTTKSSFEQPLADMLLLDSETPRYWPNLPPTVQPRTAANDPFLLTRMEMDDLSRSIREDLIGVKNGHHHQQQQQPAVLGQAASYFFNDEAGGGGKKFRPIMVMLLSRVLSDATAEGGGGGVSSSTVKRSITSNSSNGLFGPVHDWQRPDLAAAQRRLAQVIEMIHAASLFHDDVIDQAATRRGRPSVHAVFGNQIAILAGDYLVGRTSVVLARLRNNAVFEAMSTIIEHLVRGEVMQMAKMTSSTDNTGSSGPATNIKINGDGSNTHDDINTQRLLYYLRKNFYKTGSLMAHTCRSAAMLGDYSDQLVAASYRYGKHMGMAFQLVDDILDFHGSPAEQHHLGKPAFSDLRAGLATAPILFAAQENPQVWQPLLHRQFGHDGDVDLALSLLESSNGMERTKRLARVHAEKAMDAILEISSSSSSSSLAALENNPYRDALIHLALDVVSRTK